MRRRRDQSDSRPREPQARDHLVHLVPRQLAALPGLGALRHLDLQHFRVDEIFRRHAEASRGHLLDLGILLGAEAHRIFAALAGIRARAQAIHGDRQRLVRFRRQSTQRHAGAVKAQQYRGQRLHFLDGDGGRVGFDLEQIADARHRPLVHQRGELLVPLIVARHHRRLQRGDDVRVVHVVLAMMHVLEQAALLHDFRGIPRTPREVHRVRLQVVEIRALNAAVGPFEAQRHDRIAQAHDLEQLRAAVARDGRNSHLGHDLEQALADAAAVAAAELLARVGIHVHGTLAHQIEQRLVGEIRIDGGRAVADEAGEMVRIARRAGLDQDVALAAQTSLYQPMMHGTGREQSLNGNLALDQITVRQQQDELAGAHRCFGLIAHREDGALQVEGLVILQAQEFVRYAGIRETHDLPQFPLRQDRRTQDDLFGVLLRRHEDIGLGPDLRLQRHDDALAQRIDRRIGHLRELLAKIVVKRAHFLRQHRHRRIVAHRTHRFAFIFRQNADDFVALLRRHVVHLLKQRQGAAIEGLRRQARIDEVGLQIAHALLQPHLVRVAALQKIVHLFSVEKFGGLQIERQNLARTELALAHHVLGVVVPHSRFRRDGDVAVLGDDPAGRPQSIAVQGATGIPAVGHDDAGGTVPRLHVRRVVLIEGFEVRVDHVDRLPRGRHQQAQRMHRIESAHQQEFEHVVERLRIGSSQRHHRQDVREVRQ